MNEVWTAAVDGFERAFGGSVEVVRGVEPSLEAFSGLDAVVANRIDAPYLEKATALKAVFLPFVGVNHLPAAALQDRGIAVFNCHGNAESVAERALALALAGFGRIVEFHNDLRAGKWHGFWLTRAWRISGTPYSASAAPYSASAR